MIPLIEPRSILALTATAGPMVVRDICNTLCIPIDGEDGLNAEDVSPERPISCNSGGVRSLNCNRDNIDVFALLLQTDDERRYLVGNLFVYRNTPLGEKQDCPKISISDVSLFSINLCSSTKS